MQKLKKAIEYRDRTYEFLKIMCMPLARIDYISLLVLCEANKN